jgi:hypothetical protein
MSMEEAMEPYGQCLADYYYKGIEVPVRIVRDDGYVDEMSVKKYFRRGEKFSRLENRALDECKGKIVDLSAGVGADCLTLQDRGLDITAVEINSNACEIMERRGVKNVICSDLFNFKKPNFDTILLFGRSIGNVQDLNGLDKFLTHAKTILKSDGQIILDSIDIRKTNNPVHLAYQQKNIENGKYFGEIITRFEYNEIIGPYFGILHIDPEKLTEHSDSMGWNCEILHKEPEGNYLARLTRNITHGLN